MIFISHPNPQTPPHLHIAPRQSLPYLLGPNRTAAQTPVCVQAGIQDCHTGTRPCVQVYRIATQTSRPCTAGIQDCRTDISSVCGRYTGLPHRHPVRVQQVYRTAAQTPRPCTAGIQDCRTDTPSVCRQVHSIAAQTPRPRVQVYKAHPAGRADYRPVSDLLTRGKRRVKIIITRSLPRGGRHTPLNGLTTGAACRRPALCLSTPNCKHWFTTSFLSPSCLLYTSPSPRDISGSRMPSSA